MNASFFKVIGCLAVLVAVTFGILRERPLSQPNGILFPLAPIQGPAAAASVPSQMIQGWTMTPLASYKVEARVLAAKQYGWDSQSTLSPTDVVLGWQELSDSATLQDFKISQRDRWFFIETTSSKMSIDSVMTKVANTHLVAGSPEIERVLKKLKTGHLVEISGSLIEAQSSKGQQWRSSLTRNDTGNNSCELLYVDSIKVFGTRTASGSAPLLFAADSRRNAPATPPPAPGSPSQREPALTTTAMLSSSASRATGGASIDQPGSVPSATSARSSLSNENRLAERLEALTVAVTIEEFLEQITISGVGPRGAVINGQFCRLGELIDPVTGLRLAEVNTTTGQLRFTDDTGALYTKVR